MIGKVGPVPPSINIPASPMERKAGKAGVPS